MNFAEINGVLIHYKFIQHPSAEKKNDGTFVFINSLGTDFRIWDDVVELLKEYGNILLFDKRGHGLSAVVNGPNGLNDFTTDLLGLLEYLSIDKCIPVGLSVGGMIAQLIAFQKPSIVDKLVLCNTRFKIGNEQAWNERIGEIKEKGIGAISDGVIQRWFSEQFIKEKPASVAGYANMLERTPTEGYIQTCEAIRDADLTAQSAQIKIKTLCVVGSEDKSTLPEEVKNLADLIEGARFEVIEGSGHIPCVDNPVALSKLIIDFINK
ncbi:MAG: 3-oxoadipate enol-lactonase [Ferruginibacter sp.]